MEAASNGPRQRGGRAVNKHLRFTDEEYQQLTKRGTSGVTRTTERVRSSARRSNGRVAEDGKAKLPSSPYKSKWEAAYAQHLELMVKAGEIQGWWYEPLRLRLPGTRNFYKPDFVVQRHRDFEVNGCRARLEIHEIKGWSLNRREGITKLKTAAGLNTWATFKLVMWDRDKGQWIEQPVGARRGEG